MFDLSKITEGIGAFLSGADQQHPLDGTGLAELLSNAGIDPAMFDGLSHDEVFNLLQQHGIDPSLLDPGQVSKLLQNAGIGSNLAEMTQDWLRTRGG